MKNFTYYRPTTAEQAVALLDGTWGRTELLAGGTDLHDLQKEYVAQPEKVVSLNGLGKEFRRIGAINPPGAFSPSITIGGGVTLAEIAASKDLAAYPALTTAAGLIGGPQIRNMGTLGGNLCQRNRCWYFRDEHVQCLLKGGRKCYATEGENRYHAIFTTGHPCVIVHPSTLAPVLIAYGAKADVLGPKGKRTIEVEKLFQAPKSEAQREHTLASNEVLLSVQFGSDSPQFGNFFNASYEVRHKQAYDWPAVQAAVAFHFKQGSKTAEGVRIVLGHVAPTPLVAESAAKALEGKEVTEATAAAAGKAATEGAAPLSQNAYKLKLVEVAVKRAILTAAGAKRYWEV
ncbi:MAG TPA: FAD binding domain-containing protein [Gemmataceae bacterium]|nr:FAD binding domain-containing protein [Gemmataceae bacterium]